MLKLSLKAIFWDDIFKSFNFSLSYSTLCIFEAINLLQKVIYLYETVLMHKSHSWITLNLLIFIVSSSVIHEVFRLVLFFKYYGKFSFSFTIYNFIALYPTNFSPWLILLLSDFSICCSCFVKVICPYI